MLSLSKNRRYPGSTQCSRWKGALSSSEQPYKTKALAEEDGSKEVTLSKTVGWLLQGHFPFGLAGVHEADDLTGAGREIPD